MNWMLAAVQCMFGVGGLLVIILALMSLWGAAKWVWKGINGLVSEPIMASVKTWGRRVLLTALFCGIWAVVLLVLYGLGGVVMGVARWLG